jgi:peptidoglycan/LPS O-acetylase OafA/YrhL
MQQSEPKNFNALHVIRGIAALIVVVHHSKFILWAGGALWLQNNGLKSITDYILFGIDMLSSCGTQCVLIFFLLSGFVIYHSFQNSNKSIQHFFAIRALRIYTPYLFSLVVSIAVLHFVVTLNKGIALNGIREYNTRLLTAFNDNSIGTILKAIIFLPGKEYAGFNFSYWSLLHEAIFYLLFPLYYYIGLKGRAFLFTGYIIIYLFTKTNFIFYQLVFLGGMFLYDYYRGDRAIILKRKQFYLPLILLMFCLVNLFVKFSMNLYADVTAIATGLLCFDYLLLNKIKMGFFLKTLANISFTLYLNHLWILLICYAFYVTCFDTLIIYSRLPYYISVVVAVGISWFLYKLVEEKSLKAIKKMKAKWDKKQ